MKKMLRFARRKRSRSSCGRCSVSGYRIRAMMNAITVTRLQRMQRLVHPHELRVFLVFVKLLDRAVTIRLNGRLGLMPARQLPRREGMDARTEVSASVHCLGFP